MHCSQVSSGASQAYAMHAGQGRKAAGCGEAKAVESNDGDVETRSRDDAPRAARAEGRPARNPLVAAMMEALKGLVPGNAAAPTSSASETAEATEAGTDASTAKDQAQALKEAAYGFAHELFQALKAAGASGSDAAGETGGCRPHRCGGYGERAGGASAYGGLAQGLQRLAQAVAPAPAAATAPTTDVADTATPAASTAQPEAPADPVPAQPTETATIKTPAPAGTNGSTTAITGTGTGTSITVNLTLNFGAAPATGGAAASESPLLAAFKKLMLALNPKADAAGTPGAAGTADAKKPAELLQTFLQQIAKSLGANGSIGSDSLPAKGSLINLSA